MPTWTLDDCLDMRRADTGLRLTAQQLRDMADTLQRLAAATPDRELADTVRANSQQLRSAASVRDWRGSIQAERHV